MKKYKVEFYYGVHHFNPFLRPTKVVEVEVKEELGENEIIACALMNPDVDIPRVYTARVVDED